MDQKEVSVSVIKSLFCLTQVITQQPVTSQRQRLMTGCIELLTWKTPML